MAYRNSRAATQAAMPDFIWRGACHKGDPDTWFEPARQVEAKRVCVTRCPVVDDCRRWARDTEQSYGVWGGESPEDRGSAPKRPAPSPKPPKERCVNGHPRVPANLKPDGKCKGCEAEAAARLRPIPEDAVRVTCPGCGRSVVLLNGRLAWHKDYETQQACPVRTLEVAA
jgi:WhiB family transcriptional regulator, redox-sensing transcriptional regulator